jgi:DNA-binding XRE family transcriptional regulator
MRFQGKVERDGTYWLAEVRVFDAMTQGRTRHDALEMMADWFITMLGRPDFVVRIHVTGPAEFEVATEDTRPMVSLLLRRQRQKSGLSLAQAAERLGARSRNAYARYEQGSSVPTVEKLDTLLRAIAPGRDLVLHQSGAA